MFCFQSEVKFLGKFSHPNLVQLIGYCKEDRDLYLVYEYMQKGSLENHLFKSNLLFGLTNHYFVLPLNSSNWSRLMLNLCLLVLTEGAEPLPWHMRLKIAVGAARGLAFLHCSEKSVIYRDFKSANILLDGVANCLQPFSPLQFVSFLFLFDVSLLLFTLLHLYSL